MLTTTTLIIFSLLPLTAVASALFILREIFLRRASIASFCLFANLVWMSGVQALGYLLAIVDYKFGYWAADLYLLGIYFFFAHLLLFALHLADKKIRWQYAIYIVPLILSALHVNGLMVDSYRYEQNSLMHNDGAYAFLLELFALFSLGGCLTVLFKGTLSAKEKMIKTRTATALYSFVPLMIFFVALVVLSATEYAVSAAYVSPMIILYVSWVYYLIVGHAASNQPDAPNFFVNRIKLAIKVLTTSRDPETVTNLRKEIEQKILIEETLAKYRGHKSVIRLTANDIGIHVSTLRMKMEEYGIYDEYRSLPPRK